VPKNLDEYGKADPHIFKVYEMICDWRVEDTTAYMEKRFKSKADKENNKSLFQKFGQLVSRLFIFGTVLMLVGPSLQQFYEEQFVNEDSLQETTQQKMRK